MSEHRDQPEDSRKHIFHLLRLLLLGLVLYSVAAAVGLAIASKSTEETGDVSTSPSPLKPEQER